MGAWTAPLTFSASVLTAAQMNQQVRDNARIGHIWAPPTVVSGTGLLTTLTPYAVASIGDDSTDGAVHMSFHIPTQFSSLQRAHLVCVATIGGDLRYSVVTNWGASTEDYNLTTDSIAATTLTIVSNDVTHIDVSAAFTGIAAGDTVGFRFNRLGTIAADTISGTNFFVLGLRLEF